METRLLQAGEVEKPPRLLSSTEKGSMDSSDTFQSCQTHPYASSQEDVLDNVNNLYVNPFEGTKPGDKGSTGSLFALSSQAVRNKVRKSGSGEFGNRNVPSTSNTTSTHHQQLRSSSIKDRPQPPHHHQQQQSNNNNNNNNSSNNNHQQPAPARQPPSLQPHPLTQPPPPAPPTPASSSSSFLPHKKILASSAKLINQHLFGSTRSTSPPATPHLQPHAQQQPLPPSSLHAGPTAANASAAAAKRKPILKKSEKLVDSETEQLLSSASSANSSTFNSPLKISTPAAANTAKRNASPDLPHRSHHKNRHSQKTQKGNRTPSTSSSTNISSTSTVIPSSSSAATTTMDDKLLKQLLLDDQDLLFADELYSTKF